MGETGAGELKLNDRDEDGGAVDACGSAATLRGAAEPEPQRRSGPVACSSRFSSFKSEFVP